ncbi:avidin-related protein 4/5-like isoform X2 [Stegodyphus dumicola]|uniref:avidin-related protein 4/5-like isoform X2 n=1 Tax=Stegodyphus dumicola TaxID=202533 RepID=UPI0015AD0418|nr:avidin-related protein 4/5-like isoform X2 [Stegodyphus dumicola]
MRLIIFVLIVGLGSTYGSKCGDISGKWVNELGSLMTIEHRPLNRITGEYNTAVETFKGAAALVSNLTGTYLPVGDGALIGFSVLFNRGASLTSWVGQCIVCDGEEKLFTTWVLRRHAETPQKWMVTNVDQNTFLRLGKDADSSHYSHNRISSRRPESTRADIESKGQF